MSRINLCKINLDDLLIVKLCKVVPSRGYVNSKELYDMCKEYGYMVDVIKIQGRSMIDHRDIIIKKPTIIQEPKMVRELLTGVKLDYVNVVKTDNDTDYMYTIKTHQSEHEYFALKELADHHPTEEFLEKYLKEHEDIEGYKAHLENERFGCFCVHKTIKRELKAR